MNKLLTTDIEVYEILDKELQREEFTLELIASENFASNPVMEMCGSVMTNKYAEGYPGKRYYGGCEFVDEIETLAQNRLKKLFGVEYANVQPHSGSQANMGVFMTFLKPGDTVLGLDLSHGGHLTHGSPVNFSGKLYNFINYHVSKNTGTVDFNEVRDLAVKHKPKLIICGGSAYPRFIEFKLFRQIADEIDAFLMADIAHPSGLIAGKVHPSPVKHCHIITSTTHKTLRGPRGGVIMMGEDFKNPWKIKAPKSGRIKNVSELIDSMIMPGVQGGPLMNIIGAKAVAFGEALKPEFQMYAQKVIDNAKTMAAEFSRLQYDLVSGGTDTHIVLIDLTNKNITGKKAEKRLEIAGITVNKNMVPFDQNSPFVTSGIRIGTPAITTRGMGIDQIKIIASLIDKSLKNIDDISFLEKIKEEVSDLCKSFPIYDH